MILAHILLYVSISCLYTMSVSLKPIPVLDTEAVGLEK